MSDRFVAQSPYRIYLGVERGVVKYIIATYSGLVNPGEDSKYASRRTMLEACLAGRNLWKRMGNNPFDPDSTQGLNYRPFANN